VSCLDSHHAGPGLPWLNGGAPVPTSSRPSTPASPLKPMHGSGMSPSNSEIVMENIHTVRYACPYCWETVETALVPSELPAEFIEDCAVCCHPILLRAGLSPDGQPQVTAEAAG
jgi:hypothetical protein